MDFQCLEGSQVHLCIKAKGSFLIRIPMSDLELKALYWRPPVLSHPRRGKLWYGTDPREEDLKR